MTAGYIVSAYEEDWYVDRLNTETLKFDRVACFPADADEKMPRLMKKPIPLTVYLQRGLSANQMFVTYEDMTTAEADAMAIAQAEHNHKLRQPSLNEE